MVSGPGTIAAMTAAMASTIGAHETNGNNTNYITQWYGMNDEWCNMNVTYAAYHSGNEQSVCFGGKYAYTVYHAQAFADHGAWHAMTNGVVNSGIREGDIIFFDWDGGSSISGIDHVGYVTGRTGSVVHTIEGNIGNVCARFDRTVESIAGFGRPVYKPAGPVVPPVVNNAPWTSGRQVIWASTASVANQKLVVAGPDNPRDDVANVQAGLVAQVGLSGHEIGVWDAKTQTAYNLYRSSKMSLSGTDATGAPGETSLSHLAASSGKFQVRDFTGGYTPKYVSPPVVTPPTPTGVKWVTSVAVNEKTGVSYVRYTGGGTVANWIAAACKARGITDPTAIANWTKGYKTAIARESSGDANACNLNDSNAVTPAGYSRVADFGNGYPGGSLGGSLQPYKSSRGVAQCIPPTFAHYHCPGTSNMIYDPVANIAASMGYVGDTYGVADDGHDLASRVQQFDPTRGAKGY